MHPDYAIGLLLALLLLAYLVDVLWHPEKY